MYIARELCTIKYHAFNIGAACVSHIELKLIYRKLCASYTQNHTHIIKHEGSYSSILKSACQHFNS